MSKDTLDKAANVLAQARAYLKNKAPYIAATVYGLVPYFYRGMMAQQMGPIGVTKGMVMLVDPDSGTPSRLRNQRDESGKRTRIFAKSGNPVPNPKQS